MTSVSFRAQFLRETVLLSWLYPAAVVIGIGCAFITEHTSLKIVTTEPTIQLHSLPAPSAPTPEQRIWEFGFPEPIAIPSVAPASALVAHAAPTPAVTASPPQKRVALVIGNGSYVNAVGLQNPRMDAEAMAKTLRESGFRVIEGSDLSRNHMAEMIAEFGEESHGADIALLYYAGYGVAVDGTNYLLPVDANIWSAMDVRLGDAIAVDRTLDQAMSDAKIKMVFLDASAANPFTARIKSNSASRHAVIGSGLAEMKSGEDTLVAFATAPGLVALDGGGSNSPFTRALIDHITEPGVDIERALAEVSLQVRKETNGAQVPWGHSNLIGSVYLNPAPTTAAAGSGDDAELAFWRLVRGSDTVADLTAYLAAYPNGQFKSLALARIASLHSGATTAAGSLTTVDRAVFTEDATQATEDRIGLDKGKRREVQRHLTKIGFGARITGRFDDNTRSELKRWQTARGYPSTGYLNTPQYKALLGEGATAAASTEGDRGRGPANATSGSSIGAVVGGVLGGMLRRPRN